MKKVLFWTLALPLGIVVLVSDLIRAIPAAWIATTCALDQVLERYEYWSFNVDRDYFANNPYRWSVWTTWKTAFNDVMYTNGDPRW